jgi:hypothetical protein
MVVGPCTEERNMTESNRFQLVAKEVMKRGVQEIEPKKPAPFPSTEEPPPTTQPKEAPQTVGGFDVNLVGHVARSWPLTKRKPSRDFVQKLRQNVAGMFCAIKKCSMAMFIRTDPLALRLFRERKEKYEGKQINNVNLYAGSPMYYYCKCCGIQTDVLPETHSCRPTTICTPCHELRKLGVISNNGKVLI